MESPTNVRNGLFRPSEPQRDTHTCIKHSIVCTVFIKNTSSSFTSGWNDTHCQWEFTTNYDCSVESVNGPGVLSNRNTKQQRDTTTHVRETGHYAFRVTLSSFPLAASERTESHVRLHPSDHMFGNRTFQQGVCSFIWIPGRRRMLPPTDVFFALQLRSETRCLPFRYQRVEASRS